GRRAETAGATRDRFVWKPIDRRATFRTLLGHHERTRVRRPLFEVNAHDFRYDVAGAAHGHRIADANVLAPDFVFIVQRRVRDSDAADEHRLQLRDRCDGAGTSDLNADVH